MYIYMYIYIHMEKGELFAHLFLCLGTEANSVGSFAASPGNWLPELCLSKNQPYTGGTGIPGLQPCPNRAGASTALTLVQGL